MTKKLQFTDEYWAVFNQHVNDAGKRALKICKLRFGDESGMTELTKAVKDGIMAIFQADPTPASTLYASLCFVFANKLA